MDNENTSRIRNHGYFKRIVLPGRISWVFAITAMLLVFAITIPLRAQTFESSGSTGADGDFITPEDFSGNVYFKPADVGDTSLTSIETVLGRELNWDDTRFDFGEIHIRPNTYLIFSAKWTNGPIYWLATGNVTIQGQVHLNGETGSNETASFADRRPAIPGPGGFQGGWGANNGAANNPGHGPMGGRSEGNPSLYYGRFSGNQYLVPLIGGSGGSGSPGPNWITKWGRGGGAGGGAILIASPGTINITNSGLIYARGGNGGNNDASRSGSGGAIRLVATTITGNGILDTYSYYGNQNYGRTRIEAYINSWAFTIRYTSVTRGSPYGVFIPENTTPPTIYVTHIANEEIPPDPSGGFAPPDVTFNTEDPIEVRVEAHGVPVGTAVQLHLLSQDEADQLIDMPALQGTRETSTTSANVTFPIGFTRGYVRARWPEQ